MNYKTMMQYHLNIVKVSEYTNEITFMACCPKCKVAVDLKDKIMKNHYNTWILFKKEGMDPINEFRDDLQDEFIVTCPRCKIKFIDAL
jgi:phage FluMu protein Com